MFRGAIGIIETIGQVGSVEAADAMTKCADVALLGREDVGGGFHAVCVRGDVGSVRAALAAGGAAAERVGRIAGVLLISRPHDDLQILIRDFGAEVTLDGGALPRDLSRMETMSVHELRALARACTDLPLRGREISRANRDQLLAALRSRFSPPPVADAP